MAESADDETLVGNLNILLTKLEIPIELETPLDLTPFLILALFESTLRSRLPLPQATRQAKSHKDKVEAMKIVLGVLEDDVLGIDVGLEKVDPRRLAEGKPDEVRYIGEVLCWLGRKTGLLSEFSREDEAPKMNTFMLPQRGESSPRRSRRQKTPRATEGEEAGEDVFGPARKPNVFSPSIASASLDSSLLQHSAHTADDSHTAMSLHDAMHDAGDEYANEGPSLATYNLDNHSVLQPRRDLYPTRSHHLPHQNDPPPQPDATIDLDEVTAFLDSRSSRSQAPSLPSTSKVTLSRETPRRRVRVPSRRYGDESESELGQDESIEESFCRCTPKVTPPVRRTGYIHTVDFDEELRSFEATRRKQKTPKSAHVSRSIGTRPRYPGLDLRTPSRLPTDSSSPTILTRHTSPSQHTLALLEERARLLEEIARLKLEQT